MHSTHLRKDSIHGLMMGVAIGDALGLPREGLKRRVALKMFGRPVTSFQLLPAVGIYSDDTQLMLMAAQAMLRSRSEWRSFRRSFLRRLAWYPLSIPVGAGRATLTAALRSWLRFAGWITGCKSAGNGPATRAMFITLALHGTDHRTLKWIDDATRLTHNDSLAVDGCQTLSRLVQIAATSKTKSLDRAETLEQLIAGSSEKLIKEKLEQLRPFLASNRSPSAVAQHFQWDHGISGFIVPTVIMATYCFLRYPSNFERAVISSIRLGGDTDSVAAIVGGLVGAHIGFLKLPKNLVERISLTPHKTTWIDDMAERFSHWPHGVDDLHFAPALPSHPMMQVLRNLLMLLLVLFHLILRIPYIALTRSTPRRMRKR